MADSERKLPVVPETAGSYSISDDQRVDRVGAPKLGGGIDAVRLPEGDVPGRPRRRGAASRAKARTDPVAQLQVSPLPHTDGGAAPSGHSVAPAQARPQEPAAESAPLESAADPLADDVASWPPLPIPDDVRRAVSLPDGEWLGAVGVSARPSTQVNTPTGPVDTLEHAVSQTDWTAVHAMLAEVTQAEDAPAPWVLLDALAMRELGGSRAEDAYEQRRAIDAIARLMNVPADGAIALLLAKRLLRRAPTVAQQPPVKLSIAVLALGLGLGVGVGWVATALLF